MKFKKLFWLFGVVCFAFISAYLPAWASTPSSAVAENRVSGEWGEMMGEMDQTDLPPSDRRNAISVEAFGRSGRYSLNYDHQMDSQLALGIGISTFHVSERGDWSGGAAWMAPAYMNFYSGWRTHRGFATGSVVLSNLSRRLPDFDSNSNGAADHIVLGVGYEYRGRKALLFRAAAYTLASRLSVRFGLEPA